MTHPALEFLTLLDPSPTARFNIETYTDGKRRPLPDRLIYRFATKSFKDVEALLPQLKSLNAQGAAIYVAVNEFDGHRKLNNLTRVRGVHADLDDASEAQLNKLLKTLAPSIIIQSSTTTKQHWYWLLADGEELSAEAAKATNQAIAALGADRAAVDVTRLLRLPGFRNMKHNPKGKTDAQ
jgi:hypothetical protein